MNSVHSSRPSGMNWNVVIDVFDEWERGREVGGALSSLSTSDIVCLRHLIVWRADGDEYGFASMQHRDRKMSHTAENTLNWSRQERE